MEHLAQRKMTMRRKTATALDWMLVLLSAGFLLWLTFIALTGDVKWNGNGDYPDVIEAVNPRTLSKGKE